MDIYIYIETLIRLLPGMSLVQQCSASTRVEIPSKNIYISSDEIHLSCKLNGREIAIYTNEGQTLNISVIDLNNNLKGTDEIYGTINDPATKQNVVFGHGPRERHLTTSVSNEVILTIQSEHRFILRFEGK